MRKLKSAHLVGRFSLKAIDRLVKERPKLDLTIQTLLPAAYYLALRNPRPIDPKAKKVTDTFAYGHLPLRPLIHYIAGNTRKNDPALTALVTFPATIADLAHLTVFRDRVESIRLIPLRHLPGDNFFDSRILRVDQAAIQSLSGSPFEWSLEEIERFPNLRILSIHRVAHSQFARFAKLEKLRDLRILDRTLGDEELDLLRLPKSLRRLVITSPSVSEPGLTKLVRRYADIEITCQRFGNVWAKYRWRNGVLPTRTQQANVRTLRLVGDRATVDCDLLSTLPNLKQLTLAGRSPHQAAWRLTKPLPAIEELSLRSATDCDAAQLRFCPSLTSLILRRTSISDNALEYVSKMSELRKLDIRGTWVTGRTLDQLVACRDLEVLDLSWTHIRHQYLANLAGFEHLKELKLSNTQIGDEGCEPLARLPALEILDVSRTNVTDAGMKHLANCRRLQQLDISFTSVTDQGLERLSKCASLKALALRNTAATPNGLRPLSGRFPPVKLRTR